MKRNPFQSAGMYIKYNKANNAKVKAPLWCRNICSEALLVPPRMQLFSAQCCHPESVSVKPLLGRQKLPSQIFPWLRRNASRNDFNTQVLFWRSSSAIWPWRRGQVKLRGSGPADSWGGGVWCRYPRRWLSLAHCKLPSPLTLQITTAPFSPGGPGSGYRDGGGDTDLGQ